MQEMTFDEFLKNAAALVRGASVGEFVKVRTGEGNAAVIIDETEFTMLTQALSLCVEHGEWIEKR